MRGEPGSVLRIHAPRHPDADLLDVVAAALDRWRQAPPTSPTSSLSGGGAIAAFEAAFSARVDGRPSLLVPSATYGLRLALQVLGVRAGDEVIVPVLDWSSTFEAVASLGAVPVPVAVDPETLTIDPDAVGRALTDRTLAVVVCHLHGVVGDVPAVRDAAAGLPVIEDSAAALGSTLDGRTAGTLGDLAVFSLGPGKQVSAGEGGVVVSSSRSLHHRAVRLSAHPLRSALQGIPEIQPQPGTLGMRGHPLTAIVGLHLLAGWDASVQAGLHAAASRRLVGDPDVVSVVGSDRRTSTSPLVPAVTRRSSLGSVSGALVLPGDPGAVDAARNFLLEVRLVAVEGPVPGRRTGLAGAPSPI